MPAWQPNQQSSSLARRPVWHAVRCGMPSRVAAVPCGRRPVWHALRYEGRGSRQHLLAKVPRGVRWECHTRSSRLNPNPNLTYISPRDAVLQLFVILIRIVLILDGPIEFSEYPLVVVKGEGS